MPGLARFGSFRSSSSATGEGRSKAAALLGTETNGFAIHFGDMSMVIRDTTTPANNYSGSPAAKLLGTTLNRVASGLSLGASDNVYLPTSVFPYSATAFTLIAEASTTALSLNSVLAFNSSGTYAAGSGALLRISNNAAVDAGGNSSSVVKTVSPVLTAGQMIKVAASLRTSDNSMSVTNRGQAVATVTTGDWNGTSNRLQFGAITSGGAQALVGVLGWVIFLPRYDTSICASQTA